MRVTITGGAGFVGSHLCDRLIADGHEVLCLDNLSTGAKQNIAHLLENPQFAFNLHDVTTPMYFQADQIYNLACPASPVAYQHDAVGTLRTCILGAINVLGLASATGATVLQASTSEVYGDPAVHPQREDYWGNVNPIGPRGCYDEGKRCAETFFFDYHRQYGVGIKVARIFNTYGPRMAIDDGRVVTNFIAQALRGHPLTIYGDGSHTRSLCYVDDLVDGLVRLMNTPDEVTGPVNLGNPQEVTMLELAQLVARLVGSDAGVLHLPAPPDDPRRRCPDISLATRLLGWKPTVELADGLWRTIECFKAQ